MYQSSSRPTTTRDDAMMVTMMLISSTPEAYHTYHFYRATLVLCFHQNMLQSINQYLYCKLTRVIIPIMLQKNRAPKCYAGLLQSLCWEPGGLPSFKVSGDPCIIVIIDVFELPHCCKIDPG